MRLAHLKSPLAALIFSLGLLGTSGAFAAEAYTATDLNVRTGPGTGYDRIGTLPADSGVDVIDCENGWCLAAACAAGCRPTTSPAARSRPMSSCCARRFTSARATTTGRITGVRGRRTGRARRTNRGRPRSARSRPASPARAESASCQYVFTSGFSLAVSLRMNLCMCQWMAHLSA